MDEKEEMHEATKGEHITTYKPDPEDIMHLIQLEIQFEKGWISDVKEERIKAIEWGLKLLHIEALDDIREELFEIRRAIEDNRFTK